MVQSPKANEKADNKKSKGKSEMKVGAEIYVKYSSWFHEGVNPYGEMIHKLYVPGVIVSITQSGLKLRFEVIGNDPIHRPHSFYDELCVANLPKNGIPVTKDLIQTWEMGKKSLRQRPEKKANKKMSQKKVIPVKKKNQVKKKQQKPLNMLKNKPSSQPKQKIKTAKASGNHGEYSETLKKQVAKKHVTKGVPKRTLAREVGVDPRTVRSWVQQFGKEFQSASSGEFSETLKKQVAKKHVTKGVPKRTLAREFGIDPSTVRRWVHKFGKEFDSASSGKAAKEAEALKKKIVEKHLQKGTALHALAKEYGIPPSTVRDWVVRYAHLANKKPKTQVSSGTAKKPKKVSASAKKPKKVSVSAKAKPRRKRSKSKTEEVMPPKEGSRADLLKKFKYMHRNLPKEKVVEMVQGFVPTVPYEYLSFLVVFLGKHSTAPARFLKTINSLFGAAKEEVWRQKQDAAAKEIIVGVTKIHKAFGEDAVVYAGTVESYCEPFFKIRYEDGDEEEMLPTEVMKFFIEKPKEDPSQQESKAEGGKPGNTAATPKSSEVDPSKAAEGPVVVESSKDNNGAVAVGTAEDKSSNGEDAQINSATIDTLTTLAAAVAQEKGLMPTDSTALAGAVAQEKQIEVTTNLEGTPMIHL